MHLFDQEDIVAALIQQILQMTKARDLALVDRLVAGDLIDERAELLEDLVAESSLNVCHVHSDLKLTYVAKDLLSVPDKLLLEERTNKLFNGQKLLYRDYWADYLVKL